MSAAAAAARRDPATVRRVRAAALLLLLAVFVPACGPGDETAAESTTWTVPDGEGCQGLTVGWPVPAERLAERLGPGLTPAEGPSPGTGVLLLFAVECTGSEIDGDPTGDFVSSHVLIPVDPPPLPAGLAPPASPPRWVAIPRTFGPVESEVRRLFAAQGFPTEEARTALDLRPGAEGGLAARFSVATQAGGRVTVEATLADSAETFQGRTGLVHVSDGDWSVAHGPETAARYETGRAAVAFEGPPGLLGGLQLASEPPIVSLDRHFRWSFTFPRAERPTGGE